MLGAAKRRPEKFVESRQYNLGRIRNGKGLPINRNDPTAAKADSRKDANTVTREHKLALIVGFSLVLVLGVLISDHFSKSRIVESSEELHVAEARSVGAAPPGIRLASDVPSTLQPLPQNQQAFTNSLPTQPLPQMNPPAAQPPQVATFEMVNDGSIPRTSVPNELVGLTQVVPSGGMDSIPGNGQSVVPGESVVIGLTPPTPSLPVSTGQMRRHDIKEGDSLYALTKATYGDGKLWEKLREFNKGKIGAEGAVREGVTIMLPPKDVLLGKAIMPDAKSATASGNQGSPLPIGRDGKPIAQPKADGKQDVKPVRPDQRVASAGGTGGAAGYTTYTVQKGDALEGMAKRLLGSPKRWPEIVEANKSVISDPESIQVGMSLRIPSR